MHFWKINRLKRLIIERGLSEKQVFYYVLLYVGLSAAGVELISYFPIQDANAWDYLGSGLNFLIPVAGTVAAFHANGGAEGKAFAPKYFSIGFVMLMRFMVYVIPVLVVLLVYQGLSVDWSSLEDEETISTGWVEVVLLSGWYVTMYARIAKHIRDTTKPDHTNGLSQSNP